MQLSAKEGYFKNNLDVIGMVAISRTAGVWVSADEGVTWTDVSSNAVNAAVTRPLSAVLPNVSSVIIHPNNSWIYASGPKNPLTVALSTDGGLNWSAVTFGSSAYSWDPYALYAFDTGVGFVAPAPGDYGGGDAVFQMGLSTSPSINRPFYVTTLSPSRYYAVGRDRTYGFGNFAPAGQSFTIWWRWYFGNSYDTIWANTSFGGSTKYLSSQPQYSTDWGTLWTVRSDNVICTSTNDGGNWSTGQTLTGTFGVAPCTFTLRNPPLATTQAGNFSMVSSSSDNTYYTSTNLSTWTSRTLGTNSSNTPVQALTTRTGVFLWKKSDGTSVSNDSYFTTDRCVTVTPRALPIGGNGKWAGVVWAS